MLKRLLTSCLGLGRLPIAPGTWGSLPVAAAFGLLTQFGAPQVVTFMAMCGFIAAGSVICVLCAPAVVKAVGKDDPGEVVADELAGQAVTFLYLPLFIADGISAAESWALATAGFLLFRAFDIMKPWPIRKLERLPGGWGILADDLAAGLCACVLFNVCLLFDVPRILTSILAQTRGVSILQGAILGAVQGLTEFLPVSSDGHLVLFEHFFGLQAESQQMLAFDLAVHIGTVFAIFYVFRHSIRNWLTNLACSQRYGPSPLRIYKKSPSVHFLVLAFIANAATALIGLPIKEQFQQARGNLWIVAAMWVFTGTFLIITDFRKHTRLGLRQFCIIGAVIVGIAQATALMPAISRSGMTICAAVLIGLRRRWAVEFSFLCAVPAILGAAGIEFVANYREIVQSVSAGSLIVSPLVAAAVGVVALNVLIRASRRAKFKYFGLYCYALAAFVAISLLLGA